MDRPRGIGFVSTNSCKKESLIGNISGFLGFLRHYIPGAAPSIQSYSSLFRNGFLPFVVYLQYRGVASTTISPHTFTCIRVLHYLAAKAARQGQQYSPAKLQLRDQQVEYLKCLVQQLSIHNPPKPVLDLAQMKEDGDWVESEVLVQYSHKMVSAAVQQLRELESIVQQAVEGDVGLESDDWKDHICPDLAREVHDALLCAFLFGYFPPVRISCMLSLQHPLHVGWNPATCMDAGCRRPFCRGNRVESTADGGWMVHLYHHKTLNVLKGDPIIFPLPEELHHLMTVYTHHCWAQVRAERTRNLFVTDGGHPFNYTTFASYWLRLINEELPQVRFTPRKLRHVYVTNRMEHPEQPGPSNAAAAIIMGNSEREWREAYHPHHRAQQAAAAIKASKAWAAAQLPPPPPPVVVSTPAAPPVAAQPKAAQPSFLQPSKKADTTTPSSLISDDRGTSWFSLKTQETFDSL